MLPEYKLCLPEISDRKFYYGKGNNFVGKCSAVYSKKGLIDNFALNSTQNISEQCLSFLDFIHFRHPFCAVPKDFRQRLYFRKNKSYEEYGYHYSDIYYDFYSVIDTVCRSINVFVYEKRE